MMSSFAICGSEEGRPTWAVVMMHWAVTRLVTSLSTILQQAGAWTKISLCIVTCSIRAMVQKKKNWGQLISLFKIACMQNHSIIGTMHLEAQQVARTAHLCATYGLIIR